MTKLLLDRNFTDNDVSMNHFYEPSISFSFNNYSPRLGEYCRLRLGDYLSIFTEPEVNNCFVTFQS